MESTEIIQLKKPRLRNPVLLVGLPGIGNVGRLAVGYLVAHLNAEKFAELYSPYFFNFVMIQDNMIHMLRAEFYYWKNPRKSGRDIIMLIGDAQSAENKGHYEIAGKIVDFVSKLKCREIITIGGFGTGRIARKPKVYGVPATESMREKYKDCGIDFNVGGKIGNIIGAAGIIPGIARLRGIDAMALLGETPGFPILTDPNAAEAVLKVLEKMLEIKVDLSELHEKVEEMQEFVKRMEELQKEAVEEMRRKKEQEELKYIG
jgi:uncharacterized protein (TIGR00162 family)